MLYHVLMEFGDASPTLQMKPEDGAKMIERIVCPSLDKLSKDKRVLAGGAFAGSRNVVFILEADNCDALNSFMQGLPFWAFMKKTITPLQTFESRCKQDSAFSQQLVQLVG
jgi:muconolactone delta-isomerase